MEARDLRIGNYIKLLGWDSQNGEIVYYQAFDETIKVDINTLGDIEDERSQNEYDPIPLTEEWLLKFTFTFGIKLEDFVKGKHQFVEKGKFSGVFSEEGHFYFWINTKIKYVHQLQNLFYALTGEELTIQQ